MHIMQLGCTHIARIPRSVAPSSQPASQPSDTRRIDELFSKCCAIKLSSIMSGIGCLSFAKSEELYAPYRRPQFSYNLFYFDGMCIPQTRIDIGHTRIDVPPSACNYRNVSSTFIPIPHLTQWHTAAVMFGEKFPRKLETAQIRLQAPEKFKQLWLLRALQSAYSCLHLVVVGCP